MTSRMWQRWVQIWDLKETAHAMAMVRIAMGLAVVFDYATVGALGLVPQLYGDASLGGWSGYLGRRSPPAWALLPDALADGWLLWGMLLAAGICITIGFYTRTAFLLFVLLSAQHAQILSPADRGIDTLIRNVFLILACSGAGLVWSVDAKWITGKWTGDNRLLPAWPRHLIVCQLVLIYTLAGISKFGFQWMPWGGHTALYTILQDPAVAFANFDWIENQPWFFFTQVGTAVTMAWEWSSSLLLLVFYFRFSAEQPGKLRAFSNRYRLQYIWASVGVIFHIGIAAMMQLGIFPWAMLATYFCVIHPDDLPAWVTGSAKPASPVPAARPQTAP